MTVKFMLVPAVTVSGAVSPDTLKPSPLIVACEIIRSCVPGLDSLKVWLVCDLIFTLPKLTSDGVMLIEEFVAGEEPLPVRAQLASEKMHTMQTITSRTMWWAGPFDAAFTVRLIPKHSPPFIHLLNPYYRLKLYRTAQGSSTVPRDILRTGVLFKFVSLNVRLKWRESGVRKMCRQRLSESSRPKAL
jgi:hypothetical protein